MTRHVLIGVGGSGQHVVLAYLRLLALTQPSADAVPHLFVLDADASKARGGGKRSRLIDDIFDLHRELTMGQATPPDFGLIKPYPSDNGTRLLLSNLIGDEESTRRDAGSVAHRPTA